MSDTPDDDQDDAELDDGLLPSDDEVDTENDEGGFDIDAGSDSDDDGGPDTDVDADADVGAPLDDLVERTRDGDLADDDEVMDAFDEVEVDSVETDELWAQLEQERIEETVDEPRSDTERDVRVVRKRDYCMRCQHFSPPPEVRCQHERGEILEMVDTDRFEVADCPILQGEEELENLRR